MRALGNVVSLEPPKYKKIVLFQLAVIFVLCLLSRVFFEQPETSVSIFIGGLISLVPGLYFSYQGCRYMGARSIEKTVASIFKGEIIKLLLIGCGFGLTFKYLRPIDELAVFVGFLLIHAVGILGAAKIAQER